MNGFHTLTYGKMNALNTLVSILFILVSFLGSVAEGVRIRTYYTRYYSYRYYYYYDYTTYTLSAGVIAGIVIGCLVAVAFLVGAIILCCVCCCGQRRNQAQAGRVIVAQNNSSVPVVSTTHTSATVAYYPTAPGTGSASHQHAYSAPPPSYSQVASEGNVNLGFQENK
ncbi:uncharacterized protein LOC117331749 [Pecten maximus]|uniref:uncharacterized protein LOC117331749 n=1 Tax=Pecten maximus TaxID=6579 RepID=UPI00145859EE|nr:uncharacterized protein LOC117331749 [Pecten maximus]